MERKTMQPPHSLWSLQTRLSWTNEHLSITECSFARTTWPTPENTEKKNSHHLYLLFFFSSKLMHTWKIAARTVLASFTAKRKCQGELLPLCWQLAATNLEWTRCSRLAENQLLWINLSYKRLQQSLRFVLERTFAEVVLAWNGRRLYAALPEICFYLSGMNHSNPRALQNFVWWWQ